MAVFVDVVGAKHGDAEEIQREGDRLPTLMKGRLS